MCSAHTQTHGYTRSHTQSLPHMPPFRMTWAQNDTQLPKAPTPATHLATHILYNTQADGQSHGDTDTHSPLHTVTAAQIPLGLTQTSLAVTLPLTHRYTTPGHSLTSSHCHNSPSNHSFQLCLTYTHPLPVPPQLTHSRPHTCTATHTNSQSHPTVTQRHPRLPSTPPAPRTHPHQSHTCESHPLPTLGVLARSWGL